MTGQIPPWPHSILAGVSKAMGPIRSLRQLLLVALLGTTAGCGATGPSDEEQVLTTLSRFNTATDERDYELICEELLAPTLLEQMRAVALPCVTALKQGFSEVQDPRLTVGEVRVDGSRATAGVRTSAKGQKPVEDVVELVRVDDGWRIAALSSKGRRPAGG